jgi:hypothetical protein
MLHRKTIHLQACHHIPVEEESLVQCMQEYQQLTLVGNEEQKTWNNQNHIFSNEVPDFHLTMYFPASDPDGIFALHDNS